MPIILEVSLYTRYCHFPDRSHPAVSVTLLFLCYNQVCKVQHRGRSRGTNAVQSIRNQVWRHGVWEGLYVVTEILNRNLCDPHQYWMMYWCEYMTLCSLFRQASSALSNWSFTSDQHSHIMLWWEADKLNSYRIQWNCQSYTLWISPEAREKVINIIFSQTTIFIDWLIGTSCYSIEARQNYSERKVESVQDKQQVAPR